MSWNGSSRIIVRWSNSSCSSRRATTTCTPRRSVTTHTRADESAVYPVFRERLKEEGSDGEAETEHEAARQLIGRVRNTSDPYHLASLMSELKQADPTSCTRRGDRDPARGTRRDVGSSFGR